MHANSKLVAWNSWKAMLFADVIPKNPGDKCILDSSSSLSSETSQDTVSMRRCERQKSRRSMLSSANTPPGVTSEAIGLRSAAAIADALAQGFDDDQIRASLAFGGAQRSIADGAAGNAAAA